MNAKRTSSAPAKYLSIKKLGEYSSLGERTIREMLRDPDHPLPCFRLNRKTVLIRCDDFDAWIEQYRDRCGSQVDSIVDEMTKDF